MNALRQPYYVRKDGELIHVQGKRRFFEVGEVVESPRHLSPSHTAWTLTQLRYEIADEYSFAGKAKRKRLKAELKMIKQQLSRMRLKSTPQLQLPSIYRVGGYIRGSRSACERTLLLWKDLTVRRNLVTRVSNSRFLKGSLIFHFAKYRDPLYTRGQNHLSRDLIVTRQIGYPRDIPGGPRWARERASRVSSHYSLLTA